MSDTSYPSALPSTGTPSQCIISESFNDWNAILCPCCIYGQGGSPHCQPGSRWSSCGIRWSHSTISFLLVLASTVSGWILHGANSEMKTGLQKFLKEHSCEGMEGSKKLRKKLSCKAFPAKPQLTSQEALNQSWCFWAAPSLGKGPDIHMPHQPVIGYRLPWEEALVGLGQSGSLQQRLMWESPQFWRGGLDGAEKGPWQ